MSYLINIACYDLCFHNVLYFVRNIFYFTDLQWVPGIVYVSQHIYEIILKSVFDSKFESTSGPDMGIFKRFTKGE